MRTLPLMLFAAGFGTRMGKLTANRPKPLIEVAGTALLDHALNLATDAGLSRIVVNTHYLAEQIETHLRGKPVTIQHEAGEILETGGGLKAALPLLGERPVLTLNTDAVWTGANPLIELMTAWDEAQMDALLLLAPAGQALGHTGTGDFLLADDGRVARAKGAVAPVYLGAQIIRTEALNAISEPVFSLNRVWDVMLARGRVFGILHHGGWCDVGRPESIALAEKLLSGGDNV